MRRLLTVGIFVLASATWAGTAAWADTLIPINPGSLNKKADQYEQICDPNQGGNPAPGQDVWVFNLPKSGNDAGTFVSVTATWSVPGGGTQTRTIPTDGGGITAPVNNGTSKAWISVPDGWTLIAATAVITGTAAQFVVTHTCTKDKPGGTPSPTPDPSQDPSPNPSVTPTPGNGGGGGGSLPITGTTTMVLVALGGIAIAVGAALRFVYRRRNPLT